MIESGVMRPDDALFVKRMAHDRAREATLVADIAMNER